MSINNVNEGSQLPPNHSTNGKEPNFLEQIFSYLLQLMQDFGAAAKRLFVAEPLNIGNYTEGYKPKIIITGEKADSVALMALQKHTSHQVEFINLDKLEAKSKELDLTKDILILDIRKMPGSNPIRFFSAVDGPLHKYKEVILKFNNRGALIFKHSSESLSDEILKKQLSKQVKEMKSELVDSGYGRKVALAAQKLFRPN